MNFRMFFIIALLFAGTVVSRAFVPGPRNQMPGPQAEAFAHYVASGPSDPNAMQPAMVPSRTPHEYVSSNVQTSREFVRELPLILICGTIMLSVIGWFSYYWLLDLACHIERRRLRHQRTF